MTATTVGGRLRRRAPMAVAALVALSGAGLVATLVVPARAEGLTLADAGARTGRTVGVAVMGQRLATDAAYAAIVDREFASVTPENELKFDALQPRKDVFSFTTGDVILSWAQAHGTQVRGYAPLSGAAQSSWLAVMPTTQQREAMVKHLTTVLTHYRGRIAS